MIYKYNYECYYSNDYNNIYVSLRIKSHGSGNEFGNIKSYNISVNWYTYVEP